MKIIQYLLIGCCALGLISNSGHTMASSGSDCVEGNKQMKTEIRSLPAFQSIEVGGTFNVNITSNKSQKVAITTDANLLKHITTKVKGDTLIIATNQSICTQGKMQVTINTKTLKQITATGANDIRIDNVQTPKLNINLSGTGTLTAQGAVKQLEATLSGASNLDSRKLVSKTTNVSISGAGDAAVYASDVLEVEIQGVGDVTYFGHPKTIRQSITGVGDLIEG